jgi:hypothetical protein
MSRWSRINDVKDEVVKNYDVANTAISKGMSWVAKSGWAFVILLAIAGLLYWLG